MAAPKHLWKSQAVSDVVIPRLYRSILKAASTFPSKNRASMLEEIKEDFRKNKNETDPEKLQAQVDVAFNGLRQLRKFTTLDEDSGNWDFHTEANPIEAEGNDLN